MDEQRALAVIHAAGAGLRAGLVDRSAIAKERSGAGAAGSSSMTTVMDKTCG